MQISSLRNKRAEAEMIHARIYAFRAHGSTRVSRITKIHLCDVYVVYDLMSCMLQRSKTTGVSTIPNYISRHMASHVSTRKELCTLDK